VLFLATIPLRSGICHVHTHDQQGTHEEHGAGDDGHGGTCDHHAGQSVSGAPEGVPGPAPESGTCCSSAPSSYAVCQSGDMRSGKGVSAQALHVAVNQPTWRGPVVAVRARSAGPPGRAEPLIVSSRLRI
jgi:hypothetical protein